MISVLLPTRKRPNQLEHMIKSLKEVSCKFPEICIYVDNDDRAMIDKLNYFVDNYGVVCSIGPRLIFTDYWNKCYEKATGDILMMAADDIVFRTSGWDVMVEEEFAKYDDKIIAVCGHDTYIGVCIPSHPILHRRWVETVGYFSPPGFAHGACDYWIDDVSKFIQRQRFLPFITEHMHHLAGKSAIDETYKDSLKRYEKDNLHEQYNSRFLERLSDATKLQAVIDSYSEVNV